MAGLTFCLNRRQGTASTAVVFGDNLQPGYRVQIREQRVYGQIWEGTVDGSQVCGQGDFVGAFVVLRAILNVPAACPGAGGNDPFFQDDPPVGSGDPNVVVPIPDPQPSPLPPFPDPPMVGCPGPDEGGPSGPGGSMVDVIVTDHMGQVVSCDTCSAPMFP